MKTQTVLGTASRAVAPVAPPPLACVVACAPAVAAKNVHHSYTKPKSDKGPHILPAAAFAVDPFGAAVPGAWVVGLAPPPVVLDARLATKTVVRRCTDKTCKGGLLVTGPAALVVPGFPVVPLAAAAVVAALCAAKVRVRDITWGRAL